MLMDFTLHLIPDHRHVGEAEAVEEVLIHGFNELLVGCSEARVLTSKVYIKVTHITRWFLQARFTYS